jgi:hypothetical protein
MVLEEEKEDKEVFDMLSQAPRSSCTRQEVPKEKGKGAGMKLICRQRELQQQPRRTCRLACRSPRTTQLAAGIDTALFLNEDVDLPSDDDDDK